LVDEGLVWTTGRTVQCDSCGQRWRAVGTGVAPEPAPEDRGPEVTDPVVEPEPPNFTPLVSEIPLPDPRVEVREREPESLFIPIRRETRAPKAKTPVGPTRLVVAWVIVLIIVVALSAGVAKRDDIVRAAPGMAGLYQAVGLPTSPAASTGPRR
jgi:hypothetical protein